MNFTVQIIVFIFKIIYIICSSTTNINPGIETVSITIGKISSLVLVLRTVKTRASLELLQMIPNIQRKVLELSIILDLSI